MAPRLKTSKAVQLMVIFSVAFTAVLVLGWVRMPELQRGVRSVATEIGERVGFQP